MANGTLKLSEKSAGEGVSAREWNAVVRAVNMMLKMTGDGKYIRVNMRTAGPSVELVIGNLLGGTGVSPYRIKSIHNDYLTCRSWNGTTDGTTDVLIAKPFLLRHVSNNYPWIDTSSLATVNAQEVTVDVSSVEYTWRVTLPYAVDEVIWATATSLGDVSVSGTPLTLEDTNRAGHAWGVVE